MSDLLSLASRGLTGASWSAWVLYFLATTQGTIVAVTLYLHRSQAHRGVQFHPVIAHLFRFWCWLTTGMVTRQWVAVHRKHHARCETVEDPHSPQVFGIGTVLWRGVDLYKRAAANKDDLATFGAGTPTDWIECHLYEPWSWLGPTLLAAVSIALFGVVGVALWALQMVWIPFWAAGVINGLGHWCGYRNFETSDTSANLVPWGLLVGGEELHNNHHAFPASAKFSQHRFEFDGGWLVICLLRWFGLAKVRRVAPALGYRAHIQEPDVETIRALRVQHGRILHDYASSVIAPILAQQRFGARSVRRLRRALANGGRWLDPSTRSELAALVHARRYLTEVCDFRDRLADMTARNRRDISPLAQDLRRWCTDAESSGIRVLVEFAERLKGCRVVEVRAERPTRPSLMQPKP
ncbi:MAG TPA: fatty acid desaturase [Frateuria sp.]|uniref:DesA family fatty acid desaturase n=1 Tax=Frateuria sp. TaxID=2211372 RepID=UPI002DE80ECD|nr:fatty acid desaturase [Frateuria sp.]